MTSGLPSAPATAIGASDAFLGLLRSQAAPRVIVFEDVQWVDDATLELLRVTSRRLRTFAALIIATYRDDEVGAGHPLRIALGEVPPTSKVTISLPPLSPAAVPRWWTAPASTAQRSTSRRAATPSS